MVELLNQGWFGSLVGLTGLIIGVTGLILYRNSKIGAKPTCQTRGLGLIGKDEQELPSEVVISFKGKNVPRLTLTRIYFWNDGKETILGNQIVEDDPLRCDFDSADEILKAHVASVTRKVNKFAVSIPDDAKHRAVISFDYLDPKDGARIDLLHTSTRRNPTVAGTFRRIPKGISQATPSANWPPRKLKRLLGGPKAVFSGMFIAGYLVFIAGLLPDTWLSDVLGLLEAGGLVKRPLPTGSFRIFLLSAAVLYMASSLSVLMTIRKRYPSVLDRDLEEESHGER